MPDVNFREVVQDGCYGRSGHMHLAGLSVIGVGDSVHIRPLSTQGLSSSARYVVPLCEVEKLVATLMGVRDGRQPAGEDVMLGLLNELLGYAKDEFDGDPDRDMHLSGADTIDWLFNFRLRVKDALRSIGQHTSA